MAATAIAFRSVIANPDRAAAARSANSWAASKLARSAASRGPSEGGTASGATCHTASCGIRSGSWLVATMRSSGQAARRRWQSAAQAATRCSQLSIMISTWRDSSASASVSGSGRPGSPSIPMTAATRETIRSASHRSPSSTT